MAELSTHSSSRQGKRVHASRHSTRIDMTPMVDLAFLLLTFFILTTTLSGLRIMELTMPEPKCADVVMG